MKFQTLSLVVGTKACNASCPFCISKMTFLPNEKLICDSINIRNLKKSLRLAEIGNVTTVILTGKGETLLFPTQITTYLEELNKFNFPFIELQTNGKILEDDSINQFLSEWAQLGLTTILISNVGYDAELNRQIYFPNDPRWIDIEKIVNKCKSYGINARLTTMGIKGGIDSPNKIKMLLSWADKLGVKQLTWRPVSHPENTTMEWILKNSLDPSQIESIKDFVIKNGKLLYNLLHGAAVYDLFGQNFCLTNCLTIDPSEETIRQLIFYPTGNLYTDWSLKGSILL